MKLGFDFDLAEKCERSYHYPIPETHAQKPMLNFETHVQKSMPNSETHGQNPMPNSETHAQNPMPKSEPHEQKPMPKSEPHAQKPMLKSYTTEEQIETEFDALASLFRVASMCEHHAQIARNLSDPMAEERYLEEANHALDSAHLLFILTHK